MSLDYDYAKCAKIKKEIENCKEALYYFYYSSKKEEIFQYNKKLENEE